MPLSPPVSVHLTTLPTHDCSYLPGREAVTRAFRADVLPGDLYHDFMDAGFRRSGKVIYQPVCQSCQLCVPIRVPVDRFAPSKSQRRCWRANADLHVSADVPVPTVEKLELYQRYQTHWHGKVSESEEDSWAAMVSFLYESPVQSLEFTYRTPDQELVAVGIADVCSRSFSSVYFYFDPKHSARGLGTFGALQELQWAHQHQIPQYYLGFWVNGCGKMAYKTAFRPYQLLDANGVWQDG